VSPLDTDAMVSRLLADAESLDSAQIIDVLDVRAGDVDAEPDAEAEASDDGEPDNEDCCEAGDDRGGGGLWNNGRQIAHRMLGELFTRRAA
jgi:hypothetical protein